MNPLRPEKTWLVMTEDIFTNISWTNHMHLYFNLGFHLEFIISHRWLKYCMGQNWPWPEVMMTMITDAWIYSQGTMRDKWRKDYLSYRLDYEDCNRNRMGSIPDDSQRTPSIYGRLCSRVTKQWKKVDNNDAGCTKWCTIKEHSKTYSTHHCLMYW